MQKIIKFRYVGAIIGLGWVALWSMEFGILTALFNSPLFLIISFIASKIETSFNIGSASNILIITFWYILGYLLEGKETWIKITIITAYLFISSLIFILSIRGTNFLL